jgi:hypothetical protein
MVEEQPGRNGHSAGFADRYLGACIQPAQNIDGGFDDAGMGVSRLHDTGGKDNVGLDQDLALRLLTQLFYAVLDYLL